MTNRTLAAVAAAAAAAPALIPADPASAVITDFQTHTDQLLDINSIHVTGSVQVINVANERDLVETCCAPPVTPTPQPPVSEGALEFVAADDRWRYDVVIKNTSLPGINTEVGYDGASSFHVAHDDRRASIHTGPDRGAVATIPNPVFAAYEYLIPTSSDNPTTPELKSLQRDAVAITHTVQPVWQTAPSRDKRELEETTIDLSQTHNIDEFDLRVTRDVRFPDRPIKLEKIDPDSGVVRAAVHISHYTPIAVDQDVDVVLPERVDWLLYDPNGTLHSRVEFVLRYESLGQRSAITDDDLNIDVPSGFDLYIDDVYAGRQQ